MGVRMIPIVAVVSEDTFHALNNMLSGFPDPEPSLQAAMDRNGWTIDSLVAGTLISDGLRAVKATS